MINYKDFEGHTPGPWEIDPDTPNQVIRPPTNDAYGLSAIIADCANGNWPDEKTLANARLLAAAPELLAENKRLREALEFYAQTDHYDDTGEIARRALQGGDK